MPGDLLAHSRQNLLKGVWMIFVKILSNAGQVIARYGEMFNVSRHFAAPCGIDMKIRYMPGLNELPKRRRL